MRSRRASSVRGFGMPVTATDGVADAAVVVVAGVGDDEYGRSASRTSRRPRTVDREGRLRVKTGLASRARLRSGDRRVPAARRATSRIRNPSRGAAADHISSRPRRPQRRRTLATCRMPTTVVTGASFTTAALAPPVPRPPPTPLHDLGASHRGRADLGLARSRSSPGAPGRRRTANHRPLMAAPVA
jgi:hypothetical protein